MNGKKLANLLWTQLCLSNIGGEMKMKKILFVILLCGVMAH